MSFEDTLAAVLGFVGAEVLVDVSGVGLQGAQVLPIAFQAGVLHNVVEASDPEVGHDVSFLATVGSSGAFYLDRSSYRGSVWLGEGEHDELLVWMGPFVITLVRR